MSICISRFRINLKQAIFFTFFCFIFNSFGQENKSKQSDFTPIYGLVYKGSVSGGDLNDRWGYTNVIGAEVNFKLKNNLTFGLENHFIFGNTFKDSMIFDGLRNSDGQITSFSGAPGDVLFLLRGANFTGEVGYVFDQFSKKANSGLWLNFGLGYMYHKIRIESLYDEIPQFNGNYSKGYDKLTMGFSTKQFIGYLQQGDENVFDFYAGFEFTQGFTKNVRTYNFDSQGPENDLRFDLTFGIKLGWMIPIYKRKLQDYYY